jgi:NDP-sugar pyrophosphorylase family protein
MKEKISITISSELIKQADSLIDGITIRNRSQALESLLRNALAQKTVDCAVILAGGSIKELKFENTYKPLVNIEGAPILINSVRNLKDIGITKIIIAAGPLTNKVFRLLGDGSEYGVNIVYVKDNYAGTAGAVKSSSRYISGPFLVILADVYFDFDLKKMINFHKTNNVLATMAVSVTELGESQDSIKIIGNKITDFQYQSGNAKTHHVNAGIYIFERDIVDRLLDRGSLEKDIIPQLAKEGNLSGFVFSGNWKHLK